MSRLASVSQIPRIPHDATIRHFQELDYEDQVRFISHAFYINIITYVGRKIKMPDVLYLSISWSKIAGEIRNTHLKPAFIKINNERLILEWSLFW